MPRRTLPLLFAILLCVSSSAAFADEAGTTLHPDWGWERTALFTGVYAGFTGACACTAAVVLPLAMDVYWYASAPATWAQFTSAVSGAFEANRDAAIPLLVSGSICTATAIVCDVLLHARHAAAGTPTGDNGKTELSFMGIPFGRF